MKARERERETDRDAHTHTHTRRHSDHRSCLCLMQSADFAFRACGRSYFGCPYLQGSRPIYLCSSFPEAHIWVVSGRSGYTGLQDHRMSGEPRSTTRSFRAQPRTPRNYVQLRVTGHAKSHKPSSPNQRDVDCGMSADRQCQVSSPRNSEPERTF